MTHPSQKNILLKVLMFSLVLFIIYSCGTNKQNATSFSGEEKAINLADQMFKAIGGKEAWCELKSLYIKAEHTEPGMNIPYRSEIWRDMDLFDIVIEQQNDSFHVKAVINKDGGTIRYYDKRDTSRTLTEEQLKGWEFGHNHNVYVLLHNMACNPESFNVRIDTANRLAFYQDSTFYTSFGLDDQMRPHQFYTPNMQGKVSGSVFTKWGTDDGLIHSAGGHPLDSSFMYNTEIWKPEKVSLREAFGEEVFDIE